MSVLCLQLAVVPPSGQINQLTQVQFQVCHSSLSEHTETCTDLASVVELTNLHQDESTYFAAPATLPSLHRSAPVYHQNFDCSKA